MLPSAISGEALTTQRSGTLEFVLQRLGCVLEGANPHLGKGTHELSSREASDLGSELLGYSAHLVKLRRGGNSQFRGIAARVALQSGKCFVADLDLNRVSHWRLW